MDRTSEIQQIITELRDTASSLSDIASRLYEFFSADEAQEQTAVSVAEPQKQLKKQLTLEEVRAACAEKSRAGFTAEVKAIITKYGADKLSTVKPEDYAAVLAEVEVLSNAD